MNAVALRRPAAIFTDDLPPINHGPYKYNSESMSTTGSNLCSDEFEFSKRRSSRSKKGLYWGQLVKAKQHT